MSDHASQRQAGRFVRRCRPNGDLDKRKLAQALARDYWRRRQEADERVRALRPKPSRKPETRPLSDAQFVMAHRTVSTGSSQLSRKIAALTKFPTELFVAAVEIGDVDKCGRFRSCIGDLVSHQRAVVQLQEHGRACRAARSRDADLLLAIVAINAGTRWEKGGFGVLEQVTPDRPLRSSPAAPDRHFGGGQPRPCIEAHKCIAQVRLWFTRRRRR